MKFINETLYGWKLGAMRTNLKFENVPELLDEFQNHPDMEMFTGSRDFNGNWEPNKLHIFQTTDNACTRLEYNIYFNNLQIRYAIDEDNNALMEMFIAKDDTPWMIIDNDCRSDNAEKFRVYVWERKKFTTGNLIDDEEYTSGMWNKYVYHQVRALLNLFEVSEEALEYNKIYSKKKNNENKTTKEARRRSAA